MMKFTAALFVMVFLATYVESATCTGAAKSANDTGAGHCSDCKTASTSECETCTDGYFGLVGYCPTACLANCAKCTDTGTVCNACTTAAVGDLTGFLPVTGGTCTFGCDAATCKGCDVSDKASPKCTTCKTDFPNLDKNDKTKCTKDSASTIAMFITVALIMFAF